MEHYLTYVPFASWCWACVKGRARDAPHRRLDPDRGAEGDEDPPVLQLDYMYLGREGEELWPIMIAWDSRSGAGLAVARGRRDEEIHFRQRP